ncbi:MAG: hypothetical protein R2851_18565 [Caldilineaceae bacterium]
MDRAALAEQAAAKARSWWTLTFRHVRPWLVTVVDAAATLPIG